MSENYASLKKGLYIVPTPIGNLADITLRALEILKNSNYILCEDTRISKKLLEKYKIKSKLISNHKFNEKKNLLKIIGFLRSGLVISLISDAGTPGVSDPGLILINECLKNDIEIIPLPGASAVTSAISIGTRKSGLSEQYFCIASSYGILGNGAGVTLRGVPSAKLANSSKTPAKTGSITLKTSSWVTKDISISSW